MGDSRWLDSLRIPERPIHRSHSDIGWASTRGAGVRNGNPGVFYDDSGRLFYQGDGPPPEGKRFGSLPREHNWRRQMRPDDTLTYDPRKVQSEVRGPRSYEFNRGTVDTPRSSGRTLITKHYDEYKRSPVMDYRPRGEVLPPAPVVTGGYYRTGGRHVREGSVIIEERIVSHERPWIWPLFMITGFLMLAAGIANLLFCVDYHYFAYLWVPIFLVIFAIFGALHRGIYRGSGKKWRNWGYIIMGILTTIVVAFCCAMVQIRLNHVTIQISEHGPGDFILYETDRMTIYNQLPRVNLSESLETNIWACYSIDWVGLILVLVSFAVLPSVVVIANNYYNSNYRYTREVEPFCRPALFNPYGQISVGQAMVFLGIVLATSAHGNFQIRYQDYWIAAWSAIFPMVAGAVSAFALKRIGLRNGRCLVIVALVLEFITVLVMIINIGIYTYTLYENILTIVEGPISTTNYSESLITASITLFVILDIVLLVALIYSLALFIRLFLEGCRKDRKPSERREFAEERYAERYPEKYEREGVVNPDFVDDVRGFREVERF